MTRQYVKSIVKNGIKRCILCKKWKESEEDFAILKIGKKKGQRGETCKKCKDRREQIKEESFLKITEEDVNVYDAQDVIDRIEKETREKMSW